MELSELEEWDHRKRQYKEWWEERVTRAFGNVQRAVPKSDGPGLRLDAAFLGVIPDAGEFVERLVEPFQTQTIMFKNLRRKLVSNLEAARSRPSRSRATPRHLIDLYLRGTPLRAIFDAKVEVLIPENRRFEHTWFLAGSGSGKTTAFRWMITEDLKAVARGEASVIVMEPKGDLLDLARLPLFRDQPDRLVILDPEDNITINPFERSRDDLATFNAAHGVVKYLVEGIMGSAFTANHETILSFAFELVWRIPDATLFTLIDLLQRGLVDEYKSRVDAIPEWEVRQWILRNFDSPEYRPRARETAQRLNLIIKEPTFRALFGSPKSTFDLYKAMNAGKLILIDANKNILDDRAKAYGRFFIALIDRAAKMRRHYMRGEKKIPVFAYIDEAHDYIKDDKKTEEILAQARDQNIGLLLAHQDTEQVGATKSSLFTNTSIKVVSRPEVDIGRLAETMHTDRDTLTSLPRYHFALYIRHETPSAVAVKFPLVHLDRMPERDFEHVRQHVRDRYCAPPPGPPQSRPLQSVSQRNDVPPEPREPPPARPAHNDRASDDDTGPADWQP